MSADLSFLCDEHVPYGVVDAIRELGCDVQHVVQVGLRSISDPDLLRVAQSQDRVLLTRNYRDFAPLVSDWVQRKESFPGVLFFSYSIGPNDIGAHIRALKAWLESDADVANTYGWLS